ncbi:MAG: hypothetical protein N2645_09465 [Clostridia bacterium]|nr:hypothetical protein [Clostridia bacterium]
MISFLFIHIFADTNLFFKITINNHLTFNYPLEFQVDNIYIHETIEPEAVITNSSIKKPLRREFKTYTSMEGKFSFMYPSLFTLSQKDFSGSEILYHIDFHNKANTIHGFVQVWNLPYSLQSFLEQSKANSVANYKYFKSNEIKINDIPGFHWDYSILGNDGKYYKGSEVFLKKDNRMYRISYFVPENLWDKNQSEIFWKMVNSFKIL